MANKAKIVQKIVELSGKVEEAILIKLLEEETTFTGKFMIEINCSQGGITGTEIYTLRKIS